MRCRQAVLLAHSRRQRGPFCRGKRCAWLSFGRKLVLAGLNSVSRKQEAFEPDEVSVTSGHFNATS